MTTKKRIYIAGPITKGSLLDNVNQATAAFIALTKAGFAPMNPMWSVYSKPAMWFNRDENRIGCIGTVNGNDEMSHDDWMGIDLPWVECADAVLRLPGESTGADLETSHAEKHSIPVFNSIEDLVIKLGA